MHIFSKGGSQEETQGPTYSCVSVGCSHPFCSATLVARAFSTFRI